MNVRSHNRNDSPSSIADAAVKWLVRRDRGLTAKESAEFADWLQADTRHPAAVAELERTWEKFTSLREIVPAACVEADADAFAPPAGTRAHRRVWVFATALSVAAAVIVFAIIPLGSRRDSGPLRFVTAPGGFERVALADGSTVELNADTALDVHFTRGARTVTLARGEAHFIVAKSPARPFVVAVGAVAVRAVGTVFNIRRAPAAIEVLVTEGKVRVENASQGGSLQTPAGASAIAEPLLTAGERIVIPLASGIAAAEKSVVSTGEIERILAWQNRTIELQGTTLAVLVREFNRYNSRKLVVDDPELAGMLIGGKFRVDEADAFVRLLEATFGVTAERSEQQIVLRKISQ